MFWIADLSIESYKPTKSRLEFALDVASGDFKDSEPKDTESVAKNYDFFIRMATKYNLRSKARRLVKDALNLIAENYSMVNSEISIDALERGCRIFVETLQRYDLKDLVLRYIRKSETLSMQIPDAHSMMAARR